MEKRSKLVPRKRKAQVPEEDEKQNDSILEEVMSISGKAVDESVEKEDSPPPARMKRSASKSKDKPVSQPKKENVKKTSVSPPLSPPSKQKKPADEEKEVDTTNDSKAVVKGDPVPNLPEGWRRQTVVRRSGKTAGQIDIYFYSPEGTKLRSRPDVASYLAKNKIDLKVEEFDFSKSVKAAEPIVKKKPMVNNKSPKKRTKTMKDEEKVDEVESKEAAKAVPPKKSRSKVPPSVDDEEKNNVNVAEKNNAGGKSTKHLVKILESKPKRSRK